MDCTGAKTCSKCGQEKPLTEYYAHHTNLDGLFRWCKVCHRSDNLKRKRRERGQPTEGELSPRPPRKSKRPHHHVKDIFGLTHREYNSLVQSLRIEQNNLCAVCGCSLDERQANVDHCHATMRVRGLLCHLCNRGLGYLKDDPELLAKGIVYLNTHSGGK